MPDTYVIEAASQGIAVAIGINNAPIVTDLAAEGIRTSRAINEWIMPEGNALTAYLVWPDDRDFEPGLAEVHSRVFRPRPETSPPEPLELLAEFRWPVPDQPEAYPHTVEVPFQVKDPPPTRLWADAAPIETLSDLDRRLIIERVNEFASLVGSGDVPGTVALTEYKWREDARANQKDEQRMLDVASQSYTMVARKNGTPSPPIEPKSADFHISTGRRVVTVTRDGGLPPVTVTTERMRFSFAMHLARIADEWTIVR